MSSCHRVAPIPRLNDGACVRKHVFQHFACFLRDELLTIASYLTYPFLIITAPHTLTPEERFFAEPVHPRQRQYEALRAYFLEGLPSAEAARLFGYTPGSFRILCLRFRRDNERAFFRDLPRGPQSQPKKDAVRARVVEMRKRNFSVYDIHEELARSGHSRLSVTAIQEVLSDAGFSRLPRRADDERPEGTRPTADQIADVRQFAMSPREFTTRAGGLFLLLPLLAQLDLDGLVSACNLPGTKMIPAAHAIRAGIVMKLLGKARRSHVMDLLFDEGVALAMGLNAPPKSTFMWQYSTRLGRKSILRMLSVWVERLRAEKLIDTSSFNLDFHSISHFGDDPIIEKHYVPRRSQRRKAVLTFFAQDANGQVFCYSNADIRKGEENDEVLRFVEFWERRYGERPKHLVFDSKLTTHEHLRKLHDLGITFITLRRRSPRVVKDIVNAPRSAWTTVHLDVPHRKFKTPQVIDQTVTIKDYGDTPLRQLLVRDLGHDEPTVLLTNDTRSSPKALITRYARRMLIENGLADSVDFFHLDALSSAVALNVDFDVLLTVIASGIYRLFARSVHGFDRAQARQLFRRFLDTTARVIIDGRNVTVRLPRRAHNPLLIDAGLIGRSVKIPWWDGAQLTVQIV